MLPNLADRVVQLKPSATVETSERVRAARAAGRRILGISSGDPNIDADSRIVDAAHEAIRRGDTRYGPPAGSPALREAVAKREQQRTGTAVDPSDVIITPGGKFALYASLMGVVNAGDEVLVPEPGWVSYSPCVTLCGGVPVGVSMLDQINESAMQCVVTPRTKALIINSPVNPTGRVFSDAELKSVLAFATRNNLWILFDQVYCDLLYIDKFPSILSNPGARERTFVIDSFSKTFGMTGWRLGYLVAPPGLAKTFLKFVQHSTYCVPGFVQAAGLTALSLYDELTSKYRKMFKRRLDFAADKLSKVPGIKCSTPPATFYLFPSVEIDDVEVSRNWLDNIDVASVPGSSFGALGRNHLRLSLTCSDDELAETLNRIAGYGLSGNREKSA